MAVICVALFMSSIDHTIVATALPSIQDDLGAPITWAIWTITAYALGMIVALPVAGRLSDQFGRKRIFLAAVVLFTVASILCALATNVYVLVAFRALQALGGGAFMPSAVGIVSDIYGRNRDRAVALFTSVLPVGALVGPVLGGMLVAAWSWRAIFAINIPLGVGVLVLGWLLLPRQQRKDGGQLDALGIVLFVIGMVGLMAGVSNLGVSGPAALDVIIPAAVGIVVLGLFAWHSARTPHPFFPVRFLTRRQYAVMNVINLFSGAGTIGFGSLLALYAVDRYGMSILQAGSMLTARAIGTIAIAGIAALAIRRTGYRWPLRVGFSLAGAGFIGASIAPPPGTLPEFWLAAWAAIVGIGMGISIPSNNNAGLELAPQDAAAVAGIRGMIRQTGGIIGVSVIAAASAGSGDAAATQAMAFLIFGIVVLLLIPLIGFMPERRGAW